MATTETQDIVKRLISAAYLKQVLEISYYAPIGAKELLREIEPYAVIEIDGRKMLKCYQIAPVRGWRLFDVALIGAVHEIGAMFLPRRPTVIKSNGGLQHIAPVESRDYEQQEYEKLLQSCIIDLAVGPSEKRALAEYRDKYGLTPEEVRGVHYKIFADCLAAVTKDRLVTEEERQMLIELNACLRECGAGLIQ